MGQKRTYKQYSKEFKEETVALVRGQGYNVPEAGMFLLLAVMINLKQLFTMRYTLLNHLLVILFLTGISLPKSGYAGKTEATGNMLQILIPSIALGSAFYLDDQPGQIQFYKSFAATFVTTHTLKLIVDKERPDGSANNSFPSGHTSAAFQGASFIHLRYGLYYALPAYLGATFVGYSRVVSDKHYVEDVVAGAAIGILSNYIFTEPYKGFDIALSAGNGSYGLLLSRTW